MHMLPQAHLRIDVVVYVHAFGAPFAHRLAATVAHQAQAQGLSVIPVITCYDSVKTCASALGVDINSLETFPFKRGKNKSGFSFEGKFCTMI